MSIIYDALKKTQNKRDAVVQNELRPKRGQWKKIVSIIIVFTFFISLLIYSPVLIKKFKPKPAPVVAAKLPPLILNGIFISPSNRFVQINQHFFQTGEVVNGMKIVSITYKKVILQNGNSLFELEAPV